MFMNHHKDLMFPPDQCRSSDPALVSTEPGSKAVRINGLLKVFHSTSLDFGSPVLWIRTIPGPAPQQETQHSPCERRSPISGVPLTSNEAGHTPSASSCSLQQEAQLVKQNRLTSGLGAARGSGSRTIITLCCFRGITMNKVSPTGFFSSLDCGP